MKRTLLAISSGLLYTLAFPSYNLWPLMWIFAIPLFFSVHELKPKDAFIMGMISGFVAWTGTLYWIAYVMNDFGALNLLVSTFTLAILVLYLCLYFGVFAWIACSHIHSKYAALSLPGIWILLELIRSYVFTGFPWALAGHSQFPFKPLIQIAEFGGVYLISGLIIMANVAIYKAFKKESQSLIITGVLIFTSIFWGHWRMINFSSQGESFTAAIAQANIPQEEKWLSEKIMSTVETFSQLTESAIDSGADLVVWPESSCNFYLFREWRPTSRVITLSKKYPTPILAGGAAYEDGKYFNREWLLCSGNLCGYYDKVHLVPFGEYLPLSSLLQPFLGTMVQEVSDFSKGEKLEPIGDMGVLICFESIFPDISRTLAKKGATYLVNTSNDAWFKTWATPEQHLQIASFRAIENRRWLIRSVNHGISAFIDPSGRITSFLGLLKEGVIVEDIKKNSYLTFYARYGALIAWLWGILGVCLIIRKNCKTQTVTYVLTCTSFYYLLLTP